MNIEWKQCFKVGVSIFVLYLCITYWEGVAGVIGMALGSITPIIIGICIAYMINLLMGFLERNLFPNGFKGKVDLYARTICMIISIVLTVGIIIILVYTIIPEVVHCISQMTEQLPKLVRDFTSSDFAKKHLSQQRIDQINNLRWQQYLKNIGAFLMGGGKAGTAINAQGAATAVANVATSVASMAFSILMAIIFSLYFLTGKETMLEQTKRISTVFLKEKTTDKLTHIIHVADDCFRSYLVGKLIDAVVLGAMCALVMLVFRLPYVAMISILIGFTALIPIVGAYAGTAIGALMMLTVSPSKAVLFLVIVLVVQLVEGNVIYPKIMGTSLGLPGVWVLAAVTIGGSTFGIVGMLIGVPIVAIIYRLAIEEIEKREDKKEVIKEK